MESQKEQQTRLEKLRIIQSKGVEAYPSISRNEINIADAKKKLGKKLWVAGKLISIRDHGKSKFGDLKDESGKIQLYFKKDILGSNKYDFLGLIDAGDYLEASGEIFRTRMGEITVKVEDYKLLSKSLLPLPGQWYGLKNIEQRYRKRFIDLLINKEVRENLELKSKLILFLRNFMIENGFVEIETPTLQPIPGGAAAKPFITSYNILNTEFYLRIAPELYLKRLIVGGFEKIFEIGKAFRNEGLSHMHNPEFTIFEFYWAYKDYKFIMEFTEKLISKTIKKLKSSLVVEYQGQKINFPPPYKKIKFADLIKKDSGIDIMHFRDFESLKREIKKKDIKIENLQEIKVWPKLVDELYKKVSRDKIVQPTFIIDHPIELSPLAKESEKDVNTAQRFQLVCGGGLELVNAYSELNNPLKQRERIEKQLEMRGVGFEESEMLDLNFIEALEYGLPPTAGWGMGIDRFAMLLTNQYSIKEVIPFPALKPEKRQVSSSLAKRKKGTAKG